MIETKVGPEVLVDLPLFARRDDPETSHRAAQDARGRAGAQRRQILAALTLAPQTNDSLDEMMGWRVGTASRRTAELADPKRFDPPLIRRTDQMRPTRTGSQAFVFEVTR